MAAELIFKFNEEEVKFPVEWSGHDIVELSTEKNAEGIYFEDEYENLWLLGNPEIFVVAENGSFSVVKYEEMSGMFYSVEPFENKMQSKMKIK